MLLQLAYLILFIVLLIIILWVVEQAMQKNDIPSSTRKRNLGIILGVLFSWLVIQYIVSEIGFYDDPSLPPRIPLFMILPLFTFTAVFLFWNRNNKVLHAIPIYFPIAYQSFRAVIEVLFYLTFLNSILPVQVTFEGANYDVLLGISAIFVGIYASRETASKKALIVWNIIGIAVIAFAAFTFITSFYFPSIWGGDVKFSAEFLQFPFLLLPAFFMPSGIFMHILSIIQLKNRLQNEI